MASELKKQEEIAYPKGWAFVSNQGEAYTYIRGLWDTPLDGIRARHFFVSEAKPVDKKQLDELATRAIKLPSKYNKEISSVLHAILPKETQQLMEKVPPYFVVMPKEFFDVMGKSKPGAQSGGLAFFSDTDGTFLGIWKGSKSNVFFIREDIYKENEGNIGYMTAILAHEALHYAEALSNKQGHTENRGLHEGITEYFAKKYTYQKGLGIPNEPDVYPLETAMAFVFSKVIGEEELKNAYFTGDFSKLKKAINGLGGFGMWERLTDPVAKAGNNYGQEEYDRGFAILRTIVEKGELDKTELNEGLKNLGKHGKIEFSDGVFKLGSF